MLLVFALLFNLCVSAESNQYVFNTGTAIDWMLKHNGDVAASKNMIEFAEGQVDQADAILYPKADFYIFTAPIFRASGNYAYSTTDWTQWGLSTKLKGSVTQALFTFGIAESYKTASKAGLEVATSKTELKTAEKVFETKKYIYSFQLANDLFDVAQKAKEEFQKAIDKAEELVEQRNKNVKKEDLFKLKTNFALLLDKYAEAQRGQDLANSALRWILAIPDGVEFSLEEESLVPEDVELKSFDEYLEIKKKKRPEYKMVTSGLDATKSLWDAQRFQKRPTIFAIGFWDLTYTPIRDNQKGTFVYNPYNALTGGVAIGLKLNLDWWNIDAVSKQAKSQYEQLLDSKKTMLDGLALQIKKTYVEAVDYKNLVDIAMEGEKNAQKWFMHASMSYATGNTGAEDMLQALKGYFEAKINFNMAIFKYNMALAELSKAIGEEVVSSIQY